MCSTRCPRACGLIATFGVRDRKKPEEQAIKSVCVWPCYSRLVCSEPFAESQRCQSNSLFLTEEGVARVRSNTNKSLFMQKSHAQHRA